MKPGATYMHSFRAPIDLALIDTAVITYCPEKSKQVLIERRYPEQTEVWEGLILVSLSQSDTLTLEAALRPGERRVRVEMQMNLVNGAVVKSTILPVHICDTLATAMVDGSAPAREMPEQIYDFAAGEIVYIKGEDGGYYTPEASEDGTMLKFVPSKEGMPEAGPVPMGGVKDWNENDPASPKYIEGRTHYKVPTYPSDAPMIETLTAGVTLLYDFTGLSATYVNRILYENAADPDCDYPFEWSWEAKLSTGWMAATNTSAGNGFAEKIDNANFRIMGNKRYNFYLYFISDPAVLTAEYAAEFPSKGIYVTVNEDGVSQIRNFKGGFVAVVQLNQNYIPSTIARTADTVPLQQSTSDAGKVLMIGEDGKVGAGDSTDANAVHYTAETPTVDQQMQARANLGLYYKEETFLKSVDVVLTGGSGYAHLGTLPVGDIHVEMIEPGDTSPIHFYGTAKYNGNPADDYYFECSGKNTNMILKYTFGEWTYGGGGLEVYDGTYTMSVYSVEKQQVPEEYIPDSIARKEYVDEAVANAGGSLIVTITENDDGTFTPSHTSQEIYAAYMGGKSVTAGKDGDNPVYDLQDCAEDYAVFDRTADGSDIIVREVYEIDGTEVTFISWTHPDATPMTPATAEADGAAGLVPAPAAGQQDAVLHGDGTWREVTEKWERCRYFAIPSASNLNTDNSGITWFADESNNVYGFEIETTDEGKRFAYKNLYIKARQGGTAGANKSATIYINDIMIGVWTTAQVNLLNRVGRVKIKRMGAGYELSWSGMSAVSVTNNWVNSAALTNDAGFANGNSGKVDGEIKKIKLICAPENYFAGDYLVGIWGEL